MREGSVGLTEGEPQRVLDKVHDALERAEDGVQHQLEEVDDGRDEALEHLQDRLEEVRHAGCDTHFDGGGSGVCLVSIFEGFTLYLALQADNN